MCFIYRDHTDIRTLGKTDKGTCAQAFRRNVKQFIGIRISLILCTDDLFENVAFPLACLFAVLSARKIQTVFVGIYSAGNAGCRYIVFQKTADLILQKGHERRYDKRQPVKQHGRYLKTHGLAAARRHDSQRIMT